MLTSNPYPILKVRISLEKYGQMTVLPFLAKKGGLMQKSPRNVRVVSREEIQEQQKPKRRPRAQNREISYRPFEDALRHVTIKEAKK